MRPAACVVSLVVAGACARAAPTNAPVEPQTVDIAAPRDTGGTIVVETDAAPPEPKATAEPALDGGEPIGVAECDAYIAKWQTCFNDPTMLTAAQPAFATMREAWRKIAQEGDPYRAKQLAVGCAEALKQLETNPACKP